MNSKKIILPAFILVALAQLYVPAKMILDREVVLLTGTGYKFKTAPIDPGDPFRGKYITLDFEEITVTIPNEQDWIIGETVYVSFTTDKEGYAKIKSVSLAKPVKEHDFLEAKVRYVTNNGSNKLTIDYPFDRYYMAESKAHDAELVYRRSLRDTNRTTFALVNIKNGNAVLKDVLIDGISIKEMVKRESQK
jgi:uncharacterized membrane-anchored protein